jgi:hypothetical protein
MKVKQNKPCFYYPRSEKAVKVSMCAFCEASTSVKQCYATKGKHMSQTMKQYLE